MWVILIVFLGLPWLVLGKHALKATNIPNLYIKLLPWYWAIAAIGYASCTVLFGAINWLQTPWYAFLTCNCIGLLLVLGLAIYKPLLLNFLQDKQQDNSPKNWAENVVIAFIFLLILITFSAGLLLPPNNWDSMTYHLSRILFWQQNNALDFYPTANTRQLYQPPFAEWIAFTGWKLDHQTDRGLFLIQWLSYLSCLALTWELLKKTLLSRWTRLVSVGILAALPMAILQSGSTQNDMLLSFWVLSMLFALQHPKSEKWLIVAGICVACAIMTKGTALIIIPPLVLVWAILNFRVINWFGLLKVAPVVLVFFLLLYGKQLSQNYSLTGHLLGVNAEEQIMYANQIHTIGSIVNTVMRNLTMHFGVIGLDQSITDVLRSAIDNLTGISVDDPSITFPNTRFETHGTTSEDTATNLIAFILILIASVLMVIKPKKSSLAQPIVVMFLGGSFLSFLCFCYLFKWQPWHSRLHLPFFVLMTPIATALVVERLNAKALGTQITFCLLVGTGIWFGLKNDRRQLGNPTHWKASGLTAYYAANQEGMGPEVEMLCNLVQANQVKTLGLFLEGDQWDYPFLKFSQEHSITCCNVAGGNPTSKLMTNLHPQVILVDLSLKPDTSALRSAVIKKGDYFWLVNAKPETISILEGFRKVALH